MGGDLLRWKRAVEGDDALGEQLGQPAVAVGDEPAKVLVLTLDPVETGGMPRARRHRVDVEHERAVGQEAARDVEVELENPLGAEPARDSLVDDGRVDEAVTHDGGAALE